MANGCCTNDLCVDRETQLRLARLREELLTNFNTLLIDRIRFLEHTINRLSLISPPTSTTVSSTSVDKRLTTEPVNKNRLLPPSSLRRSSSATTYFLQSPVDPNVTATGAGVRSCPSSVDLSSNKERQKWFSSNKKPLRLQDRTSSESNHNFLSIPIHRQWASSAHDLISSTGVNSEKGRLETRRFACDVDDNEVRAFKAMVYMEQARKQHARPLTRLRQALGMSSNSSAGSFTSNSSKKQTNS